MADEERQDEEQVDVQKRYLMAKIDELIEGVGPGYGQALLEELITRMEHTVAHFHEEVTELLEVLKSRDRERSKRLESLAKEEGKKEEGEKEEGKKEEGEKEEGEKEEIEEEAVTTSAETEMSEWEKKLEAQENGGEVEKEGGEDEEEEKKQKKRGLFGRKKKD